MIAEWKAYFYTKYRFRIYAALLLGLTGVAASVATIYAAPLHGASTLSSGVEALNCGKALTSQFSKIAGVPLGIFGVFYFSFWTLNLRAFQLTSHLGYVCVLSWITLLGAVVSVVLFCLMFFVIKAPCLYCLITHSCNLLSFALLWPVRQWKHPAAFSAEQFRHFMALTVISLLSGVSLHLGNQVRILTAQLETAKTQSLDLPVKL
jgi:uncharacterized membrane protein